MKTDLGPTTSGAPPTVVLAPGPSTTLRRVFQTLEQAGIRYCVLHGYDGLPDDVSSDVDCVVSADVLPLRLAAVLRADAANLGAEIVQWFADEAHFIVMAGRDSQGELFFLQLHAHASYDLARRTFYDAEDLLQGRRRHDVFWVPAPAVEFGCLLARRVAKGDLRKEHADILGRLYLQDPEGCLREAARLWGPEHSALIVGAAREAKWDNVRRELNALRAEQNRRALRKNPWVVISNWRSAVKRRLSREWRADRGLNVVVLGPDGSGKSSVIEALRRDLGPAFIGSQRRTFPPGLLKRGSGTTNATPHAQRYRSFVNSSVRAVCYWFVYCAVSHYSAIRRALARATLVVHDRHLVDVLVDPRRYRYGGPSWLMRLIWRVVPKPDMIILLDAPAEVVQARKREVPEEETRRQLVAYRKLVSGSRNGHVVDAAGPLEEVVAAVQDVVLRRLAARAAEQLGLGARR